MRVADKECVCECRMWMITRAFCMRRFSAAFLHARMTATAVRAAARAASSACRRQQDVTRMCVLEATSLAYRLLAANRRAHLWAALHAERDSDAKGAATVWRAARTARRSLTVASLH